MTLKSRYVFVFGPDNLKKYEELTVERLIKLTYYEDFDCRHTRDFNIKYPFKSGIKDPNSLTKAEISEALTNIVCIPDEIVQTFTERIHSDDIFAERIAKFENDQRSYLYNMLIINLKKSKDEAHEILENAAYIYDSTIPTVGVYVCGMGLGYRNSTDEYGYIEVANDGTDYEGLVLLNRNSWYLFETFENHDYDDDGLVEKIYNYIISKNDK